MSQNPTELGLTPHHVGISVADLDAAVAWYSDMLGFRLEGHGFIETAGVKLAVVKQGDFRLELFQAPGSVPVPEARRYPDPDLFFQGTKHMALGVDDLEAVLGRLKQKGVEVVLDLLEIGGTRVAYIRDNSGILVELVERGDFFADPTLD